MKYSEVFIWSAFISPGAYDGDSDSFVWTQWIQLKSDVAKIDFAVFEVNRALYSCIRTISALLYSTVNNLKLWTAESTR